MSTIRKRRAPPAFRKAVVAAVERRRPRMAKITLSGPALDGFDIGLPAASIRLLLPPEGASALSMPVWNGNEFLLEDGRRPTIRTLTPMHFDPGTLELDVEIVLHGRGRLATWAATVEPGAHVAVSGTGTGYEIDDAARSFLLAGDESALPAIVTLLPLLPGRAAVRVIVEIAESSGRIDLPAPEEARVDWLQVEEGAAPGDALIAAVAAETIGKDTKVWVAGEAAAVHKIRAHLFDDLGLSRRQAVVRGYWKIGRNAGGETA
jgi:NADPH-dependent ferric siderophore reductase